MYRNRSIWLRFICFRKVSIYRSRVALPEDVIPLMLHLFLQCIDSSPLTDLGDAGGGHPSIFPYDVILAVWSSNQRRPASHRSGKVSRICGFCPFTFERKEGRVKIFDVPHPLLFGGRGVARSWDMAAVGLKTSISMLIPTFCRAYNIQWISERGHIFNWPLQDRAAQ